MRYRILSLNFLTIILFLLSPGWTFSQGKLTNKDYQPEQGQEGKDVRWFPTPQELVDKMLDMAKVSPSDYLVDLGSGDGRTVISAARRGVRSTGIEYNPDLVELSKRNAKKEGVSDKTEFLKADLFDYDFSKATVVTLFLLPELNLRLRPKLLGMRPGTRVVSTTFTMQDWQYDDKVQITDKTTTWTTAYLWIIPAKVSGTWKFNNGEIRLKQQFQMVAGELIKDGKTVKISGGRLRGNDFTFRADAVSYAGKLENNTLKMSAYENGRQLSWTAEKLK